MSLRAPCLALLLCLALLTACGGGGGGDGGGSTPPTTPTTPPVLTGVVSVGAPLGSASLSVIDASGKSVASGSSHPVDGSYRLTLTETSPALPLLLQARGLDASGRWVLLHALLPALPTAEVRQHLTPLTQAIAGLALGGDPLTVFRTPTGSTLASTPAATTTAAQEFLRTLIKTSTSDLKLASTLDLQADTGFATAKSGPDLLLEALRIETTVEGRLLLTNKFQFNPAAEVEVKLDTARTELLKTTEPTPANAITTAAKVTSSAATVSVNLPSLDGIVSTLNPLLARAADALTLQTSDPLLGYTQQDGRDSVGLALQLAAWGAAGLQLGPLQITGCADDVAKTGDCLRVSVASALTDRDGKLQARLLDTAAYNGTSKRWTLAGNGKLLNFQLRAASLLKLNAAGDAGSASPSRGIEVLLQGRSGIATLISTATVQTPLGYALPLADCGLVHLCLATPGAAFVLASGGLEDQLLQPGSVGWLGEADALRGARYQAAYPRNGGTETRRAWLPTAVLAQPAARHPKLNGVSGTAPLSVAALSAGMGLNWGEWATANPELKLLVLRVAVRHASRADVYDFDVSGISSGRLPAIPSGVGVLGHELWLTAVDPLGQRLVTRYALGV